MHPPRNPVHIAEDRISRAFKTRAASLDLSDLDLEYLPDSIGALPELRELHVGRTLGLHYGSSLRALTPAIAGARRLEVLDLKCNHLTELPEEIGELTHLRTLELGGNEIEFLPESLGQLAELECLDLAANFLTQLPASLRRLPALRALYLHGNSLDIPDAILGPDFQEVRSGRARPADPQAILDYCFAE
jgi:Leucine-rich repeat (LRR) protein